MNRQRNTFSNQPSWQRPAVRQHISGPAGHAGVGVQLSVVLFAILMLVPGCSAIDEDLSDCGAEAELDYELRLVTNLNTELTTELSTQTEVTIANALREHLAGIFTDFAHDVDLSFYDTEGDSARLHNDKHIMDASQASYALFLPMRQYMHLATANTLDNRQVSLANEEFCHRAKLEQLSGDTIDSHTTGLFSARQPMEVLEGVDQHFNVHLYMANCAAALVIDPQGHDTTGVRVYCSGFATAFDICDSTYIFPAKSPLIRTAKLTIPDNDALVFCSVSFPSRKPQATTASASANASTRSIIEMPERFVGPADKEPLWWILIYVTNPDGTITETRFGIKESLDAGAVKVIKGKIIDDGSVVTELPEVSVSVTLNWKKGNIFTPTI